ncbi:MAG TPA: M1 family aminopeptidase [Bryobacteraceae bacterium]|jgi:alanyl aminopeptidase|nr:M1 family aminopeptidase [Bryobacteraceae bacterium]
MFRRPALVCLAVVLNLPRAAAPQTPQFELPGTVQPRRYSLDLTIVPARTVFTGSVIIDLEIMEPASRVWLHGKDLDVVSAFLSAREGVLRARAISSGGEFLAFDLPQVVAPGPARLEVRYRGKLSGGTAGAYRRQAGGRWYVFTSFTAIEARRAFPCFDEPRYKTPWRVTLHVNREEVALSNTSSLNESPEPDGMKRVEFGESPPLPSSLVAFAVGPFDVVAAGRAGKNGVPVRIITPRGRSRQAAAARDLTADLLPRLETYTGIAYPFEKLDHLAALGSFFGATEYPGLITYQDDILLPAPGPERLDRLRRIMSHELAHQWFGNLVTMSGWRDVWLSEGFATWMASKFSGGEFSRVLDRVQIMAIDRRPVRLDPRSRREMRDLYNRIVYEKGAATLAMVEHWIGETPFRSGIRSYLAEYRFAGVTTQDFVRALSHAAGKDLAPVFDSFLDRTGFPEVTADIRCSPHSEPRVVLEQKGTAVWRLPVCVKADGAGVQCVEMEGREKEMALTGAGRCPAWVLPNAGAAGYYRTPVSPGQFAALWSARDLSAAERLGLVLDAPRIPVPLLRKIAQDNEPAVAFAALAAAGVISAIMASI